MRIAHEKAEWPFLSVEMGRQEMLGHLSRFKIQDSRFKIQDSASLLSVETGRQEMLGHP